MVTGRGGPPWNTTATWPMRVHSGIAWKVSCSQALVKHEYGKLKTIEILGSFTRIWEREGERGVVHIGSLVNLLPSLIIPILLIAESILELSGESAAQKTTLNTNTGILALCWSTRNLNLWLNPHDYLAPVWRSQAHTAVRRTLKAVVCNSRELTPNSIVISAITTSNPLFPRSTKSPSNGHCHCLAL